MKIELFHQHFPIGVDPTLYRAPFLRSYVNVVFLLGECNRVLMESGNSSSSGTCDSITRCRSHFSIHFLEADRKKKNDVRPNSLGTRIGDIDK